MSEVPSMKLKAYRFQTVFANTMAQYVQTRCPYLVSCECKNACSDLRCWASVYVQLNQSSKDEFVELLIATSHGNIKCATHRELLHKQTVDAIKNNVLPVLHPLTYRMQAHALAVYEKYCNSLSQNDITAATTAVISAISADIAMRYGNEPARRLLTNFIAHRIKKYFVDVTCKSSKNEPNRKNELRSKTIYCQESSAADKIWLAWPESTVCCDTARTSDSELSFRFIAFDNL